MHVERHSITLTTAADGSATVYSPHVTGRVLGIRVVVGTLDTGTDLTITAEATGEAIMTVANVAANTSYYPRVGVNAASDGAAATLDGTRLMRDYVYLANDRVKIIAAQGGNVTTGTVIVIIG